MRFTLAVLALLFGSLLAGAEAPKFRTDDGKDTKLPWYQVVDGEFPPENSAHEINGELIYVDHLERIFRIRVDRDDTQQRGVWDLAVEAQMLPYGSIYYHGAPAALQDIPLGTHLRGLFYMKSPKDNSPPPPGPYNRVTPDVDFRHCFRIEDDFSFDSRQHGSWKIEAVDLKAKKLTATLQRDGKSVDKPKLFDLLSSTNVYVGKQFAEMENLQPGQTVLFDLTWVTLYGPGRITDIWLDDVSRQLATAKQLERHRNHIRERGLAGWVQTVDDEKQIVTITFFGGVDPKLFEELTLINEEPFGWPLMKPEDDPKAPKGTIAVSRECLMTYDPVNDRKGGNIISIKHILVEPGSSGVQIQVKCDMLLEGYRPKHIVRFYPGAWKVDSLPREEKWEGRE